jgi:Na+/proline symporter
MLFGGIFLYLSYYGCDQSQAQRLLAARDESAARRALLLNGLVRFPLVLTYCGFGLLLAGLLRTDASFAASMADAPADSLVPVFITTYLPVGLRGLMVAGILAAAMSSIDSALNSLAAVTLEDVFGRAAGTESVWQGRLVSLLWGLFAIGAGFVCAASGAGVLELINLVGSVFYGPLLGVFTLGVLVPGVRGRDALTALVAGIGTNLLLAFAAPALPWLWWNPIGWLTTCAVAALLARARPALPRPAASRAETVALTAGFAVMLILLALI